MELLVKWRAFLLVRGPSPSYFTKPLPTMTMKRADHKRKVTVNKSLVKLALAKKSAVKLELAKKSVVTMGSDSVIQANFR